MGAIDRHAGTIYVPLEGTSPATLLVLDAATFAIVGEAPLVLHGDKAPWCAVHPHTGLVDRSPFHDDPGPVTLSVYQPIWSGGRMVRCAPVGAPSLRELKTRSAVTRCTSNTMAWTPRISIARKRSSRRRGPACATR